MKVLTAAQMREVDRKTIELGIPGLILMENAGQRFAAFLERESTDFERQRIVVVCGKGNNGGDGLVVARQLYTRFRLRSLDVVLAADPAELQGDAAANYRMLLAAGCPVHCEITPEMTRATVVVDALLGTGISGPVRGPAAAVIEEINTRFPDARIYSVDLPSGMDSDNPAASGSHVRAYRTFTFTAPKICHALGAEGIGKWECAPIGTPPALYADDPSIFLHLSEPRVFAHLFRPRPADSNKGMYGHALVVAGGRGKTGAAAMSGVAALRVGAGLVTVASAASAINPIAAYAPEIMTDPLPETDAGMIRELPGEALHRKTVVAIGPGMGQAPETAGLIRRLVHELEVPMVVDADALNALGQEPFQHKGPRVLTPHPGEMSRLTGLTIAQVQADRIGVARGYAQERAVHLVLKGNRTVIAFPDGRVFINPTGSPALAKAGTGDVLTGILAGLVAQFPGDLGPAVLAGVYVHGRAGELGGQRLGDKGFLAADLFDYLPEAMRELTCFSHEL